MSVQHLAQQGLTFTEGARCYHNITVLVGPDVDSSRPVRKQHLFALRCGEDKTPPFQKGKLTNISSRGSRKIQESRIVFQTELGEFSEALADVRPAARASLEQCSSINRTRLPSGVLKPAGREFLAGLCYPYMLNANK